jgi:chromate transporter
VTLGRLALVFTILSLLGFGGGSAIIPQMHADAVERFHWITSADFSRFFALARLAPGPTTTMAALIGYVVAGFTGACVATVAVFVPAGALVYAVDHVWGRMQGHPWRDRLARAIKPVVLGLIWAGVVTLAQGALDGPVTIALALVATVVLLRTEWNQALLVLGAGVLGAVVLRG